ncbi:MAG: TetR/AcrR family transcriptional regulator, partial [Nocardioides sp.]|uniref:TetR/AcrR family transcriptional regulator n=1 Tax=Nocardioides sp. TaxID=35761 RepID=UPI0039E3FB12
GVGGGVSRDPRRSAVIAGALAAIEEEGPDVGLASIARRAGLQRPNVYRVFPSKDDLDREVALTAAIQLADVVRPHLTDSGTMTQIARSVIASGMEWAAEHPHLYRFVAAHQQESGRASFLAEMVEAVRAYVRASGMAIEVSDGALAPLMAMVDVGIVWWLDHGDEPKEAVTDRLARHVALCLRDIAAELGLEIPGDMVFAPAALARAGSAPAG